MPLAAGTRLGRYEIVALVGAGGMGEVYRARDGQLQREVAIKVYSEERFSDRFAREALAVAALNHPHICALYDVGPNHLVMEYIDGRPLKGPLPLERVLKYADEICQALDAAHAKKITHRDLKPGNILVTKTGLKLLDFGLARVADAADASTLTQAGDVMGTPAYMAPEQWAGKPADARTDIYAFGCVLYELLTGKRAAEERKPVEPPALERVLALCLARDPEERWQSAKDLRYALDLVRLQSPSAAESPARPSLAWGAAAVLAVLAAVALWAPWRRLAATGTSASIPPLGQTEIDLDLGAPVATTDHPGSDFILSPDGTRVVFVAQGTNGTSRLMTRLLSSSQPPLELKGTEGAFAPFFSPDGKSVGFFTIGELKKTLLEGGEPVVLCEAPWGRGGSWGENHKIVASPDSQGGLFLVPEEGGKAEPLTKLKPGELSHRWSQVVATSGKVVFTVNSYFANFDQASVGVLSRSGSNPTILLTNVGTCARYLPTGHLTYLSRGNLFAVPFDVEKEVVRGTPTKLLDDVSDDSIYGFAHAAFSLNGRLLYRKGRANRLRTIQWMDANGKLEPIISKPGDYQFPRLSPDGTKLVWMINRGTSTDLEIFDGEHEPRRLTDGRSVCSYPVWSPDGQYIVFSLPDGIAWVRPDEPGHPHLLTTNQASRFPASFTPDGKRLAYTDLPSGGAVIWILPVTIDHGQPQAGQPKEFLRTTVGQAFPAFSPDGNWLAYDGGESGGHQVYVIALDGGGRKLVSSGAGTMPTWSTNRHELFYRTLDTETLMVVSYTTNGGVFNAEKARVWSERRLANLGLTPNFTLAPDGKRFAVLMENDRQEPQQARSQVTLVPNFFDELRARAPVTK